MSQDTHSVLEAAQARVKAAHKNPDVDPAELERAEQDLIYAQAEHDAATPWADSPEDEAQALKPERVALDGGHVDVDVIDQHVEATMTLGDRAMLGIALTAAEAARLGEALTAAARAAHAAQAAQVDLGGVDTVADLYRTAKATGVPMSALVAGMDR